MARQGRLKLRARDPEDLRVLSACLQDALVPLADIAFLKPERRFVLVVNRFMWESAPEESELSAEVGAKAEAEAAAPGAEDGDARFEDAEGAMPPYQRVNAGLTFDRVRAVRFRGFDARKRDEILNLLSIEADPQSVTLSFSGGGAIRLEVAEILCHLEDLGQPWPTRWRPHHQDEAAASEAGED
ncbi:MAG: DUF2948 family protein [Kiloniellales bacterium]|nr:DUF2948 family protein [Kiloniellales bacterium]